MGVRLLTVTFDAHDPRRAASFWARLLGREPLDDQDGLLLAGRGDQLGLHFAPSPAAKVGKNRVHLHLTSAGAQDQERTVAVATSWCRSS